MEAEAVRWDSAGWEPAPTAGGTPAPQYAGETVGLDGGGETSALLLTVFDSIDYTLLIIA